MKGSFYALTPMSWTLSAFIGTDDGGSYSWTLVFDSIVLAMLICLNNENCIRHDQLLLPFPIGKLTFVGYSAVFIFFSKWLLCKHTPLPHSKIVSILWHQYDGPKVHLFWPTTGGLFCCSLSFLQWLYAYYESNKRWIRLNEWMARLSTYSNSTFKDIFEACTPVSWTSGAWIRTKKGGRWICISVVVTIFKRLNNLNGLIQSQ